MITRLVRVELLRLWSRRLVKVALVLLVGGMLVANTIDFMTKDASAADARARAEREAENQRENCLRFLKEFPELQESGQIPPGEPPPDCSEEAYAAENFLGSRRYVLASSGRDDIIGAGIAFAVIAFVVGTSFSGAEWAAGTMGALLFWEPRRLRVLFAKILALGGSTLLAGLLVTAFQLSLSYLKAEFRGSTAVAAGFWGDRAVDGARLAAIAVFAALLAFGIAGIARVTAAALGIAFAYFAILENVIRGLRPGWRRYLLGEQFQAWVDGRVHLPNGHQIDVGPTFVLERARAGSTLAIYLTVVLGVMIVLFARRDVT